VQTIILSAGAIAFAVIGYRHFDSAVFASKVSGNWMSILPQTRPAELQGVVAGGTDYSLFGALVAVWLAKGLLLCFSGPEQLYDFQRFLAARDARDASKLGALWGAIHTVRWPFAMAIAVMAIMGLGNPALDAALKRDPETALPVIISAMLPVGLVGFMLAALLSGFLATFSSTVNGGAAYLVKDVYQRYINPEAAPKTLIRASYLASSLLILTGILISYFGTSINTAFLWIFGTLAAGILPPNVLRWYWWRLNGWGYAAGVLGGMALSLGQAVADTSLFSSPLPLYVGFPIIAIASTIVTITVTLLTKPADLRTLESFYENVQPAGAWSPIRARVLARNLQFKRETPFRLEALNTLLALVGICALYVGTLYLILNRHVTAFACFSTTAIMCVALYFTWYKHLPPSAPLTSEEEMILEGNAPSLPLGNPAD
jgi:Na+/proline symporter